MIRYFLIMSVMIHAQCCVAVPFSASLVDSLKNGIKKHPMMLATAAIVTPVAIYSGKRWYQNYQNHKKFGELSDDTFLRTMQKELMRVRSQFDIYFAIFAATSDNKFCIAYSDEEPLKEFLPLDSFVLQDFLINQVISHESPGSYPYLEFVDATQKAIYYLDSLRKLVNFRIQNLENPSMLENFIALEMNIENAIENLCYVKSCVHHLPNYQLEAYPKKIRKQYTFCAAIMTACALIYRTYASSTQHALTA